MPLTGTFQAMLPRGIENWAQQTFRTASAPTFDAIILALAIALSILGTLKALLAQKEIPLRMQFHNRDLFGGCCPR